MSISIEKQHPLFAAELSGIDVGADITPEIIAAVENAVDQFAVVIMPGQDITDEQQIEFARHFGPRESPAIAASGFAEKGHRLPQYLFDASNLGLDNEILPPGHARREMRAADRLWHTDSSFNPLPTKWSMLSARIIPPEGGNTDFADARAAYDALDENMKERIEELVAEHSLWHSRKKGGLKTVTNAQEQGLPPVTHRVVRQIPGTERKAYMAGAHARRIIGMDEAEGAALLQELTDFATRPEFVYSHQWRTNDLVIWDNRCTLHRGTPFDDEKFKRDMRRTTIDEFAPSWAKVG
ncbi:MAG: TauD/TfdA family dioxygenase [Rhodospirillales bacterium]|nr:TauD/TfdA family dioxygenase [Rhodospirillales bacterium]